MLESFVVCRCGDPKYIVVGSKKFANMIMNDLKKEYNKKIDKEYGKILAEEYKKMIFWSLNGPIPIKIENKKK